MKKISLKMMIFKFFCLCLIICLLPAFDIHATPPQAVPGIAIHIVSEECSSDEFTSGYIDLLVKREDIKNPILSSPSPLFLSLFPEVEHIDYLGVDDTEWTSYLAYVSYAHVESYGSCYVIFAAELDDYLNYSEVKIVFFNNFGETLYISDAIELEYPDKHEGRYGEIQFHAKEPYSIENNYSISGSLWFIIVIFIFLRIFPFVILMIFMFYVIKIIIKRKSI